MTNREKALANDKRIEEMAAYVITKGTTESMYPKGVMNATQEELQMAMAKHMMRIQDKFAELKRLIKNGEFTMAELEDKVYEDYGVMEEPPRANALDSLDAIKKLINPDGGNPFAKGEHKIQGFNQDV